MSILPPKIQQHPAETSRQQFQQLLTCHICFCHANNPLMCPYCSKLYCQNCIRRCLVHKPQCPHCRKQIKNGTTMANCGRFVNQLITIVGELVQEKGKQEICSEHSIPINYFCQTCLEPVCCQCQIFGKHMGHTLKKLSEIYQARYQVLREMLSQFKGRLKQRQGGLRQMETQLAFIKKERDRSTKQLDQLTHLWRDRLQGESQDEGAGLTEFANKIENILKSLIEVQQELQAKADQAERLGTYSLPEELLTKVQSCLKQELPKISAPPPSILNELIPPFNENIFIVPNFLQLRRTSPQIYSPSIHIDGSQFRLKLHQSQQNNYLSISIQLTSTIHQPRIYQYKIQLINYRNVLQSILRQGQGEMQIGTTLGIHKYARMESLGRQGFLGIDGQIEIRYSIRRQGYYGVYKDKQNYLKKIENQLAQQQAQIEKLQKMLKQTTFQENLTDSEQDLKSTQIQNNTENNHST